MRATVLGILVTFWILGWLGLCAVAQDAEAAPACEARSTAHTSEHGGLAADSMWHVAHGERPTCSSESITTAVPVPQEDNDTDKDRKSRWCRRHAVC